MTISGQAHAIISVSNQFHVGYLAHQSLYIT